MNDMREEKKKRLVKRQRKLEKFRSKFSAKQIHIITAILEIIIIVVAVKLNMLDGYNWFYIVMTIVLGLFMFFIVEDVVFDIDGRQIKEADQEIISKILKKYHLVRNEFVEVMVYPSKDSQIINDLIGTLEELDVKFYAKLTENDSIIIVKKDKEGQMIGDAEEIFNLTYFDSTYGPKD